MFKVAVKVAVKVAGASKTIVKSGKKADKVLRIHTARNKRQTTSKQRAGKRALDRERTQQNI
jgi:hypothetical protein